MFDGEEKRFTVVCKRCDKKFVVGGVESMDILLIWNMDGNNMYYYFKDISEYNHELIKKANNCFIGEDTENAAVLELDTLLDLGDIIKLETPFGGLFIDIIYEAGYIS
mgnify:CR=1 FL=1